jgi:hypothetical protein
MLGCRALSPGTLTGMTKRYAAALLVGAGLLLGGCGKDAICGGGEYPVQSIGGTGRQCVSNQQDPPPGFARYPAGKEPKHVDDQWDVYWRTHTVDAQGNIVTVR